MCASAIRHDVYVMLYNFLRIFKSHPQKLFLLDLLKYVLKNNVFKFDNLIFTQTCGLAMGTKLAPALATIYIRHMKESFFNAELLNQNSGLDT